MGRIRDLPLLVNLMGLGGLAMFVPALHAYAGRELPLARAFLYSGVLVLVLSAFIAVATAANPRDRSPRGQLLSLVAGFALLPAVLGLPVANALTGVGFFDIWWEMIASLTTTGATLFEPAALPPSVHLWRAMVGWLGGYFVLVAGMAVLAPMNLGGFEVLRGTTAGSGTAGGQAARSADPAERLYQTAAAILPAYGGLTAVLAVALVLAGDEALVAVCHAMSVLSTSGITPLAEGVAPLSGRSGEAIIGLFMIFALSRHLMPSRRREARRSLRDDAELKTAFAVIIMVTVVMMLRPVLTREAGDGSILEAAWGVFFTALSYLTTTGFVSQDWADARLWSGLAAPGLMLAGLATIGGGVATTAGGVKLLRVYALFRHGEREIEKLIHPNSLGGSGTQARILRRQGAMMAWVFFMLFAMSIAVVMLLLSLTGLDFLATTSFAVASLSLSGPLVAASGEAMPTWAMLDPFARAITAGAMILGRLETLALIALLNPEFWRR